MTSRPVKDSKQHLRLDPATRRAQLVEAAADVFRGRHPSEVSFEEVAEAAGVSRSLVYAYFGDRGGLIAAVYLHNLERLDTELGRALDERLPDEVRLRRIIRRYLLFARDNQASWNLMAAAGVNWTVGQTYTESPQALIDAVNLCLELGADVNATNSMGLTALLGAANRGSNDIIELLVKRGARLDIKDREGRTPLRWAEGVFLASVGAERKPATIALLERLIAESQKK